MGNTVIYVCLIQQLDPNGVIHITNFAFGRDFDFLQGDLLLVLLSKMIGIGDNAFIVFGHNVT